MDRWKVGVLAGIVSAIAFIVQAVPGAVLARWQSSGLERDLPVMFGSAGRTWTVYQYGLDTAEPLVTVLLTIGLGYVLGQHINIDNEYREFLDTVTISSILAVTLSWMLVVVWYGGTGFSWLSWLFISAMLSEIASVSLIVIVGVFAGAAFASFGTERPVPHCDRPR